MKRFRYVPGEYADNRDLRHAEGGPRPTPTPSYGTAGNRVYYLATIPDVFGRWPSALGQGRLQPSRRGRRLRPARGREALRPRPRQRPRPRRHPARARSTRSQIFRIDHYLGKETVQNVLALRFANAIFEPIWNRRYVDHVQITVAEELGVEHRGGFYETAGALRDIVQNHVMQVLALTLMEPPATDRRPGHPRREGQAAAGRRSSPTADEAVDQRRCAGQYAAGRDRRRAGRRLPRGGGRRPPQPDRDLRGHAAGRRQLALGRGAGLRPHRQAPPRAGPPRWPCSSSGSRTSPSGARSPATCAPTCWCCASSPTRASACASGPRSRARRSGLQSVAMDFSYAEAFPGTAARRLRAAAARRDDRRPHPVHPDRRGRAGLADRRPLPRGLEPRTACPCPSTRPGPGARTRPTSCWRGEPAPVARACERPPPRHASDVVDDVAGALRRRSVVDASRPGPGPASSSCCRAARPPAAATSAWPERGRIDWSLVDIYMGDERCVPPDDPDANQRLVREALIEPRRGAWAPSTPCRATGRAPRPTTRLRSALGSAPRPRPPRPRARRPHRLAVPRLGRPRRPAGRLVVATRPTPNDRNPHDAHDPHPTRPSARARLVVFTVSGAAKHEAVAPDLGAAPTCPPPACAARRGPLARRPRGGRPAGVAGRRPGRRRGGDG